MPTVLFSCRRVAKNVILGALFLVAGSAAKATGAPEALTYDAGSARLSAATETIPASTLLLAIADIAGIRVRVRGDVGTVRAQSFDDLPLDQAIQWLFRSPDRSLVMLYEATPDGGQRLAEVRLSAGQPGTSASRAPLPQRATPSDPTATTHDGLPPPPIYLRLPPPPP